MTEKDAYWFTHDSNARNDIRILSVRMAYGWEGYGAFFAIIETLRESAGYVIPCENIGAVLFELRISSEIFEKLLSEKLIEKNENSYFSASLLSRMEQWEATKQARKDAGRKGGKQKSSNAKAKLKQRSSKGLAKPKQNVPSIEQDRIGDEITEEKKRSAKREPSSEGLRLADALVKSILSWKSDYKKPNSLNAWATDFDRMMTIDNRTPERIEVVINWLSSDAFWQVNVMSGSKLRSQFDRLEAAMRRDGQKTPKNGQVIDAGQTQATTLPVKPKEEIEPFHSELHDKYRAGRIERDRIAAEKAAMEANNVH